MGLGKRRSSLLFTKEEEKLNNWQGNDDAHSFGGEDTGWEEEAPKKEGRNRKIE